MSRTATAAVVAAFALILPDAAAARDAKPVTLPPPQTDGGMPLMRALAQRHSTRELAPDELSPQILSNLLWAAFGINRADTGKRTAPSAMNRQEIDIYVARADGLFRYDAEANALVPVLDEDIRAATGTQGYVKSAAVNLIYVADLSRLGSASAEDRALYTGADTGVIAQNVYLFAASAGLATVVRGSVHREALAKRMGLRPDQRVILCQSVGMPKKK